MLTLDRSRCQLMVIDFQVRLMPAIAEGEAAVSNALRLIRAAQLLEVPACVTEQNPAGLGHSLPEIAAAGLPTLSKMHFDASRADGFATLLAAGRDDIVVTGCEAHVCVLQTVLGLLDHGLRVQVVADAIGSRRVQNREAALARMARHGAQIVTTEMVVFEWLEDATHPHFREAVALIK
jgi:nicotinamidase-related amidase